MVTLKTNFNHCYMALKSILPRSILNVLLIFLSTGFVHSQKKPEENFLGKADMYKAKKSALEYLNDSTIVKKYGLISDAIWDYAELGMQEFRSSALLIKTLEDEGFTVERGVAGMPTCFVASWGSGKPVIGILGEYDALPMISQKALNTVQNPVVDGAPGHGCGHNMMGTAGVASAIAVKRSMEEHRLQGTIKFFGSPAEETVISRPYMVREGVFKDVDAVIDNHASTDLTTSYGVNGNALISAVFSFKGKTSHAAGAPWSGISALDGVELMNIATNYLREHLFYTYRMHYVVTEGGEAPNVVPDRASVWYYIRNTDERLEEMYKRVLDCARGASLASGAELDTVTVLTAIHQRHSNKGMAETIQRNIELIGLPQWSEGEQSFAKALQKELGEKENGYPGKTKGIERAISYSGWRWFVRCRRSNTYNSYRHTQFPRRRSGRNRPSLVVSCSWLWFCSMERTQYRSQSYGCFCIGSSNQPETSGRYTERI